MIVCNVFVHVDTALERLLLATDVHVYAPIDSINHQPQAAFSFLTDMKLHNVV